MEQQQHQQLQPHQQQQQQQQQQQPPPAAGAVLPAAMNMPPAPVFQQHIPPPAIPPGMMMMPPGGPPPPPPPFAGHMGMGPPMMPGAPPLMPGMMPPLQQPPLPVAVHHYPPAALPPPVPPQPQVSSSAAAHKEQPPPSQKPQQSPRQKSQPPPAEKSLQLPAEKSQQAEREPLPPRVPVDLCPPGGLSVYIGAIPKSWSREKVEHLLRLCGRVSTWERAVDGLDHARPFGFVTYVYTLSVMTLIQALQHPDVRGELEAAAKGDPSSSSNADSPSTRCLFCIPGRKALSRIHNARELYAEYARSETKKADSGVSGSAVADDQGEEQEQEQEQEHKEEQQQQQEDKEQEEMSTPKQEADEAENLLTERVRSTSARVVDLMLQFLREQRKSAGEVGDGTTLMERLADASKKADEQSQQDNKELAHDLWEAASAAGAGALAARIPTILLPRHAVALKYGRDAGQLSGDADEANGQHQQQPLHGNDGDAADSAAIGRESANNDPLAGLNDDAEAFPLAPIDHSQPVEEFEAVDEAVVRQEIKAFRDAQQRLDEEVGRQRRKHMERALERLRAEDERRRREEDRLRALREQEEARERQHQEQLKAAREAERIEREKLEAAAKMDAGLAKASAALASAKFKTAQAKRKKRPLPTAAPVFATAGQDNDDDNGGRRSGGGSAASRATAAAADQADASGQAPGKRMRTLLSLGEDDDGHDNDNSGNTRGAPTRYEDDDDDDDNVLDDDDAFGSSSSGGASGSYAIGTAAAKGKSQTSVSASDLAAATAAANARAAAAAADAAAAATAATAATAAAAAATAATASSDPVGGNSDSRKARVATMNRKELFAAAVPWSTLQESGAFESTVQPWVERTVEEYLGETDDALVEFVVSQLQNEHCAASSLVQEMAEILDTDAETFVERLWRVLMSS